MKTIFLDTAGWLALGNKSDKWHCRAVQIYQQVARERLPRLTTDAVIIEVCNALRKPPLRPLALVLADNIYKAERLGYLEIVHVNPDLFREGLTLFRERKDKDWSLTDCISFVIMKQRGITRAFTTDHHFEQAG
ncbi:MAG: type II toxin-antitoxin system VapC family toxin, partial [Desulfotomaculales bacterium]